MNMQTCECNIYYIYDTVGLLFCVMLYTSAIMLSYAIPWYAVHAMLYHYCTKTIQH